MRKYLNIRIGKERGGIFFGFVVGAAMLFLFTLLALTGCDEGMDMMPPPAVTDPTDPVEPTDPQEPAPQPTLTIEAAAQADDGSIVVSGVSANLPEGTTVTVTLGEAITATTTTNATGAWTVTVSATETKKLSPGTVAITAAATDVAPDTGSVEYTPLPQPTVTINVAAQNDDGSVTVSGVSTDLPRGTTVTITLGDIVTATVTTDGAGAWTVTVSAANAEKLTAGTVSVVATASGAISTIGSFEYTVQTKYGVPVLTEVDRIALDVILDVTDGGAGLNLKRFHKNVLEKYDKVFNIETEAGKDGFQKVVRYEYGKVQLAINPPPSFEEELRLLDQYYEEAFGIDPDFAFELLKIYIEENPDKEYLLGGWMRVDVGIAWLIVKQANPDATDAEMLEHFRQASREGVFTISG